MRGLGKRGTWIVGGIALVLVTIVAISGFLSYANTEKAIIDKFQERQTLAADTSAESIESYFEGLARETRALATSRIVQRFDKRAVKREIGLELKELEELGVIDIRVLDASGIVKFSASEPRIEGRDFSAGRYFIKAQQAKSGSEVFVEFIRVRGTDEKMAIASPIFMPRSGREPRSTAVTFSGVVLVTLDMNIVIKRFVVPKKFVPHEHAFVIDADDRAEVIWAPSKDMVGRNLLKEARGFPQFRRTITHMVDGDRGTGEFKYFALEDKSHKFGRTEKDVFLVAYAPILIGSARWSIGIWAPKREALGSVKAVANNLVFLLMVIVLIILSTATYIVIQLSNAGKNLESQVELRTSQLRESEEKSRRIAETLQEALIKPIPRISGLDIGVVYESAFEAEQVGGDFYDIFEVGDDIVAVLIGDVSGKGIEAAGLTETVRSSVRAFAHINPEPAFILAKTNEVLIPQASPREFATANMIIIDRRQRIFRIASAGHPPPILLSKVSDLIEVKPGFPLGSMVCSYQESNYDIEAGSNLVLYTDGLLDTRRDKEFFGEIGIFKALSTIESKESDRVVRTLIEAAMDFARGQLSDDIAIISIRFLE